MSEKRRLKKNGKKSDSATKEAVIVYVQKTAGVGGENGERERGQVFKKTGGTCFHKTHI